MTTDDPSLLVDCRSTPRRPLTDPDLTHDWTPQHYPSGAIGGYYCPDCLIAGAPTSTLCPDRVAHVVAEVRRHRADVEAAAGELMVPIPAPGTTEARMLLANVAMRRERDEARAALAAARVDGARGMRDAAEGVVNARLTLCRNGIERLYDADGDCDRPEDLRAARGRENLYERVIGEIRALDPATVVGSAPPADRFPCTACPNFVPTNGAGNGWACRAIDDSADWIDRATGAVNGRMADGHEVPIPQDARTCSAFGKPATVGSRS